MVFADCKEVHSRPLQMVSISSVHSVLAHLGYKRSARSSFRNAFKSEKEILALKDNVFISSPLLGIVSQKEMK